MWTWRKIGLAAAVTISSVVVIAAIVDQVILPWIVSMTPTITVPNVVGLKAEEGRTIMQSAGLQVAQIREQYSEDTPAGTTMSQLPYADAIVKEGRRAYLTVSKGIEQIRVPRLVGLSQRDARLSLLRTGLMLGTISFRSDSLYPTGVTTAQSIPEGSRAQRESIVDIVVSSGNGAPVPDVVGLSLSEAEQVLRSSGFTIISTVQRSSAAFEPGTVIGQTPKADSAAPAGAPVTLILAK
jgi:serine/threonine-protein kinase